MVMILIFSLNYFESIHAFSRREHASIMMCKGHQRDIKVNIPVSFHRMYLRGFNIS
jgi:hypothetical protein